MARKSYEWQLPAEIERRLGETTYGRQRAIFEAGHLFVVLHALPKGDSSERECVLFLRTPDGAYQCNGMDGGETRLRRLITSYDAAYERLDDEYDRCKTAKSLFKLLEAVTPINRASTNLHTALQAARSYIDGDSFLIAMRDEAYELSRNFELLVSDAKLALDYRIARNAETQAEQSKQMAIAQHKLNVLAAITFPLMALAALMGMNLVHGLEGWPAWLFWGVVVVGGGIGMAVKRWVTRGGR